MALKISIEINKCFLFIVQTEENVRRSLYMKEAAENTTLFDWENFEDFDVKRQFSKLSVIGTAKLPEEKIKEVSKGIENIPIAPN